MKITNREKEQVVTEIQQANELTANLMGWNEQAPYPWCHGDPTVEDCIKRGYCRKDPNCGE
jgi:hypothetical protein